MRVLLTRAAEDAARTRAVLEARGHRVLSAPLIAIEPLQAAWPGGAVDAIVAASSHAFRALPEGWGPSREARRLLPLWLVGRRTCEAARASGYDGAIVSAANAVMLVLQMKKRSIGRIVYLAGRDRKPDIETALAVTNHQVDLCETYVARAVHDLPPDLHDAPGHAEIDIVLHYSRRSAEMFADLATRLPTSWIGAARHICLSEDVAEPLRPRGWTVAVATAPNETSLLDLVPAPI